LNYLLDTNACIALINGKHDRLKPVTKKSRRSVAPHREMFDKVIFWLVALSA